MKKSFKKFLSCFSAIALAASVFPASTLSFAEEMNQANEETSPPVYQEDVNEVDILNYGTTVNIEPSIILMDYQRFEGCELEFKYKAEVIGNGDPSYGEIYVDYLKDAGTYFEEDNKWLFSGFHAEKVPGEEDTYIVKINVDSIRNPYTDDYRPQRHQIEYRFYNTHIELLSAKANGMDILINDLLLKGVCVRETTAVEHISDYAGKTFTATFETYENLQSEDEMLKYFGSEQLGAWINNWWRIPQYVGFKSTPNNNVSIVAEYAGPNQFRLKLPVPEIDPNSTDENPQFPQDIMKLQFFTTVAKMTSLTVDSTVISHKMHFRANGGFNNSLMKELIVKPGDEVQPINISWDEEGNESYTVLNDNTLYRPCYKLTGFCTEKCQSPKWKRLLLKITYTDYYCHSSAHRAVYSGCKCPSVRWGKHSCQP